MSDISEALSFDDVLLIPQYFDGESRSTLDLSTEIAGVKLELPIISANMPSVTGVDMCVELGNAGGMGILHRMCSIDEECSMVDEVKRTTKGRVGASIGIGKDWKERADALIGSGADIICIDVAHGDQSRVMDVVLKFKDEFDFPLIVGNIATDSLPRKLISKNLHFDNLVYKAGVGGGCFASGTRVLMANGTYKNIEDIVPGDRIINKYGYPVSVKGKQLTGYKKTLSYKNNLFYKNTICTPDHQHWSGDLSSVSIKTLSSRGYKKILEKKTRKGFSKFKWLPISHDENFCLLMPKNIKFELEKDFVINLKKRSSGNRKNNIEYKTDVILKPCYELGYIFGTFLSDGCSNVSEYKNSRRGSVSWSFGAEKEFIAKKLEKCIKICLKKNLKIKNSKNILSCFLHYKPFAEFLTSFGKMNEKKLPSELIVYDEKYLQGIWDGLIDGDGWTESGKRENFENTSPELIELFNVIGWILNGYFPNNEYRNPSMGGLKGANEDNIRESFVARTLSKPEYRLTKYNQIVKITNKGSTGNVDVPVWDIEVDCPTHSFIANNAIVHNSMCTTRVQTGHGLPTLESLLRLKEMSGIQFIADGGIKNSGDIVKSLAAGARAVMLGSLLAGTTEAPGAIIKGKDGHKYKVYRGNASYGSKEAAGLSTEYIEGAETLVPYKGSVQKVLWQLRDGIRSGLSYSGAKDLKSLRLKAKFARITSAGWRESLPHGLL